MRKLLLFLVCLPAVISAQVDVARYVNPFIGTGGHGHTFPGATVPFGMVQLSPDTRIDGSWDGCSGYHNSDTTIYGFSHTHLSGTGCSDYGDLALLPFTKIPPSKTFDYLKQNFPFDHNTEKAEAGYYSVKLNSGIQAELTSSIRAGFHRYTFPKNAPAQLNIKITHRDKTIQSDLKMADATHLEGFRRSEAWARDQHIYFVIEFSSPATEEQVSEVKNSGIVHYKTYSFKQLNGPLLVKVGISNVSIEGARQNLEAEIPHWEFETTRSEAHAAWNKELGKIEVTSADRDKLTVFYTALYHCMIHPSTASDVNGLYRGRDNQVHKADFTYYTVFSLWDTFRALHPLYTIIDRQRTTDFIKTFLAQYREGGILPVWELSSNETWCMIGYHSVSVISDAYAKGVTDFDTKLALEAMQHSASVNYFGINLFSEKGYLEKEDEHESVSKTLEYAYDDWCIANFAEKMGENETANKYYHHSLSWQNLFDAKTGFIRPRSNGGWMEPFDPREVNNHFTEANAWQYTFFVPHDIDGMIRVHGGAENFTKKLDALFSADSKTTGRDQSDITGLIGQYAHGNEPSHHMAYLYDYAGRPHKTQERIHQIQNEFYKNAADGLIGNEDCGQMSAWYVFSAMGFYPVCPGSTQYALGTPAFEKTVIHLENGNSFTVQANGFSDRNFYIKDPEKLFVTHDEIMNGKGLVLQMTGKYEGGSKPDADKCPKTAVNQVYVPAPIIMASSKTFRESMKVGMMTYGNYKIKYAGQADNWLPSIEPYYTKEIAIDQTIGLRAHAVDEQGNTSVAAEAHFYKVPHNWTVKLLSTYNPQYTAGGDEGIIDGLKADENWRKGGWQGYQGQDFECIVDLKNETEITSVHTTFLQDQRAWIIMPVKVEYSCSLDGKTWTPYKTVNSAVDPKDEKTQIRDFSASGKKQKARYLKIKAVNFGKLPEWHIGYGMGEAFIFVDEIEVNK